MKSISVWVMFSLALVLSAESLDYSTRPWAWASSYGARHLDGETNNTAGRQLSFSGVAGDGGVALFALHQLATLTAVASPTATTAPPAPTDTTSPPPTSPPAQPTNTASIPTPANTQAPTATLSGEGTSSTATQPASAPAPPTAALPSLSPTAEQDLAEATLTAPAGEPVTETAPAVPATLSTVLTQEATKTTAILEGDLEDPTTITARVAVPPGPLLDRLTHNKPGIWGNKALYVGLAVVYIVVLTLFLTSILRSTQD